MSPEPFFRTDEYLDSYAHSQTCETCPQATNGGFCGARIQPRCLRIDSVGTVRVSLSATARSWFDTVSQFGEVLHMSRNPVAVMGKLGQAPILNDWRNYVLPRDRSNLFSPNLSEYASLWAVREATSVGVLHGLEARDNSGAAFERYLLPTGARRDLFEQFVTAYQSPPEETGIWTPPNHIWSTQRRAKLAGRIPWLRMRWHAGDRNVRRLPTRFVSRLLAEVAQEQFEIRTGFYHPALTRIAQWMPETCAEAFENGSLQFFHGSGVGLHLNQPSIASVWLWSGKCACCTNHNWSIEVADHRDHIGLAFMAANEAGESKWRDLVRSCSS